MENIQFYPKLKRSSNALIEALVNELSFSYIINMWFVIVVGILNSIRN